MCVCEWGGGGGRVMACHRSHITDVLHDERV